MIGRPLDSSTTRKEGESLGLKSLRRDVTLCLSAVDSNQIIFNSCGQDKDSTLSSIL